MFELPNLIRLEGETITGPVVSMDGDSVTIRKPDGEISTLIRPRRTIAGVLAASSADMLAIEREHLPLVTIPRAAIAKLERSDGRESRGRSAGRGFLIGAAGGGSIGLVIGSNCRSSGGFSLNCLGEPGASAGAGVIFVGGAGAVIGALTPRERWTEVPLSLLPPYRP